MIWILRKKRHLKVSNFTNFILWKPQTHQTLTVKRYEVVFCLHQSKHLNLFWTKSNFVSLFPAVKVHQQILPEHTLSDLGIPDLTCLDVRWACHWLGYPNWRVDSRKFWNRGWSAWRHLQMWSLMDPQTIVASEACCALVLDRRVVPLVWWSGGDQLGDIFKCGLLWTHRPLLHLKPVVHLCWIEG